MAWGFALGLGLGVLLINLAVEEERMKNEELMNKFYDLNGNIDRIDYIIKCKDEKIEDLQKEQVTLLENASELRTKIVDLENNLELVTNSLSDEIKELISDDQSEN